MVRISAYLTTMSKKIWFYNIVLCSCYDNTIVLASSKNTRWWEYIVWYNIANYLIRQNLVISLKLWIVVEFLIPQITWCLKYNDFKNIVFMNTNKTLYNIKYYSIIKNMILSRNYRNTLLTNRSLEVTYNVFDCLCEWA